MQRQSAFFIPLGFGRAASDKRLDLIFSLKSHRITYLSAMQMSILYCQMQRRHSILQGGVHIGLCL